MSLTGSNISSNQPSKIRTCQILLKIVGQQLVYQEVKKKESKNKREEKKGLKNKKQQKKELNDTAS